MEYKTVLFNKIPADLHLRLKVHGVKTEQTLAEIFITALNDYDDKYIID